MCGLIGIFSNNSFDKNIFLQMRDSLMERGPDDDGHWSNESQNIHLGFRRLSILDLSQAGHQPMYSQSKKWLIVFNGEIYNNQKLKKHLNIDLQGHSDTEVLVNLIEKWGVEKTLSALEGMFAFLAFDTVNQKIYLARDRFGEKPLYYGFIENDFLVASTINPFFMHPKYQWQPDTRSITNFLKYAYIPSNYSIDKRVKKLLPATYLEIDLKQINKQELVPKSYWKIENNLVIKKYDSLEHATDSLEKILFDVLTDMMIADVPLGAFLSGGIDSSLIVAMMQKISNKPIKTFTIGFEIPEFNEAEYAKKIAKYLKTEHHEKIIGIKDLKAVIPKLAKIYGEPFADASAIPTYIVSKFAREFVTVALSGDGGDEMFGGYNRYLYAKKIEKINNLNPIAKNILQHTLRNIPSSVLKKVSAITKISELSDKKNKVLSLLNSEADSVLDTFVKITNTKLSKDDSWLLRKNFESTSLIQNLMSQDMMNYLPDDIMVKVDRAAMSNSLETRAPFLHPKIADFSLSLPLKFKIEGTSGKIILKHLLKRFIPEDFFNRPKKGFSVPIREWMREDLKQDMTEMLETKEKYFSDNINHEKLKTMYQDHLSKTEDNHYALWTVLTFSYWLKEIKKDAFLKS